MKGLVLFGFRRKNRSEAEPGVARCREVKTHLDNKRGVFSFMAGARKIKGIQAKIQKAFSLAYDIVSGIKCHKIPFKNLPVKLGFLNLCS